MSVRKVLLVDDDAAVREALGQTLELADFDAVTAGSFVEAKDLIRPSFEGVISYSSPLEPDTGVPKSRTKTSLMSVSHLYQN